MKIRRERVSAAPTQACSPQGNFPSRRFRRLRRPLPGPGGHADYQAIVARTLPVVLALNLVDPKAIATRAYGHLNHRPLGYEFKGKLIRKNLHAHG
jgi:hypothetical protein